VRNSFLFDLEYSKREQQFDARKRAVGIRYGEGVTVGRDGIWEWVWVALRTSDDGGSRLIFLGAGVV
jgi:hypothetical protein